MRVTACNRLTHTPCQLKAAVSVASQVYCSPDSCCGEHAHYLPTCPRLATEKTGGHTHTNRLSKIPLADAQAAKDRIWLGAHNDFKTSADN